MTSNADIILAIETAIHNREQRTFAGWARFFGINYHHLYGVVRRSGLEAAIKPDRANGPSGVLKITQVLLGSGYKSLSIRVPAGAVTAAGFSNSRRLRYASEPGKITITAEE